MMTNSEIKTYIFENLINKETHKIISSRANKSWLEKRGMYNIISSYYSDSESLKETIYRIIHDINIRPTCKMCGRPVKFASEFSKYCSPKCRNTDPEIIAKNSASVSKSLKAAYLERGEEIKKKRAATLKTNYGIETPSPFAIKEIQDKIKSTNIERYGVDNVFRLSENRSNREFWQNYSIEYQKKLGYDIEYVYDPEIKNYKIKVKNCCKIHGDVIMDLSVFGNRTKPSRKNTTVLCPICNPLRNPETSIETIIKNFLIENNINFEIHNKTIIKPYELDFYLPDYNLAIECNGVYWHSGKKCIERHQLKYDMCKKQNIQLMYFWEDQIINSANIIYSILKSKLNLNEKIYARNCVIKEISSKESKEFINEYHLQGNVNASIRFGLFYNNELIQVMTFGKLRKCLNQKSKDGYFELYRLCSKSGITVVGGASKLLNYFIKKYSPIEIISYASKDISNGNIYKTLGFNYDGETNCGFFYVTDDYQRKNRFSLRKSVVDDGTGRTADHIIGDLGYFKCYDLGTYKFKMILNN